jgi:hypothetical protein
VIRRRRVPADPETAEALAVIARYEAALMALAEAGDRWAPERLRGVRFTRSEIDERGLCFVTQLRAKGYAREIERLTRKTPEEIHPGTFRG